MTCSIPQGWYYAGIGHSHNSRDTATSDMADLKRIFPDQDFNVILDDRGGPGYEKYIIITNVDPLYGRFSPKHRKIKKSNKKPKIKRKCKCKK